MSKKAKVTKITKMEKKDNYGNTSFVIEFDNGDKGFYTSKDEEQKKFIAGQESPEYNIEEKQGKNSKYFKITIPSDGGFGGKSFGKPQIDPKVQMISFSMSYAKDLVVAGKVELGNLISEFERIHKAMISKL